MAHDQFTDDPELPEATADSFWDAEAERPLSVHEWVETTNGPRLGPWAVIVVLLAGITAGYLTVASYSAGAFDPLLVRLGWQSVQRPDHHTSAPSERSSAAAGAKNSSESRKRLARHGTDSDPPRKADGESASAGSSSAGSSSAVEPWMTAEARRISAPLAGNPYWNLPNTLTAARHPVATQPESPDAELTRVRHAWLAGLQSRFTYQRYAAMAAMRRLAARGSATLYFAGLQQEKFWTRMEAVIGAAEAGLAVPLAWVATAIGDTRPSLVAYYARRFPDRPTAGELFIARWAIRLVGGRARASLLHAIAQSEDVQGDLYVYAGLHDPDARVRRLATRFAAWRPLTPARRQQLEQVRQSRRAWQGPTPYVAPDTRPSRGVRGPASVEVRSQTLRYFWDQGATDHSDADSRSVGFSRHR